MNLVFQQGSTLVIKAAGVSRELLISSASLSQTFLEEAQRVRTIHNNNAVARTYTNELSPVSLEFSCHLTKYDGLLLEWLGLVPDGSDKYLFSPLGILPQEYTIYLKRTGGVYKVANPVAQTISFSFNIRENALMLNVTAEGSLIEQSELPALPNHTIQSRTDFIHGALELAGYDHVGGFTLEYTKDIVWVGAKSIQEALSGIYYPKVASVADLALGGTITNYKRDSNLLYTPNTVIDFLYGDTVRIKIPQARIFDRLETGEVDLKRQDFKAQPTSQAYIQF